MAGLAVASPLSRGAPGGAPGHARGSRIVRRAPPPRRALDGDGPAMRDHDRSRDGQAQPTAAGLAGARRVQADEGLEDARGVGRVDAGPVSSTASDGLGPVGAPTARPGRPAACTSRRSRPGSARPAQRADVAEHGQRRQRADADRDAAVLGQARADLGHVEDERSRAATRAGRVRTGRGAREQQQVLGQPDRRSTSSRAEASAARYSAPERSARSATSSVPLSAVSGVRSSWAASAEKRRISRTCSPGGPACR